MSCRVPARYEHPPVRHFEDAVRASLRPRQRILDVGSGRQPALAVAARPPGCRYTGLDVSAAELALAPPGAYDDHVVADVGDPVPALLGRFDLIVSHQVLEHVRSTDRALDNLRAYLRPGGRLVALLSGRYSLFGVLNAALPPRAGVWLMHRLLRRDPASVFPAYYDGCHAGALRRALAGWTRADVRPLFQGGAYLNFCLPLRSAYFRYEDWAERSGRANLATHLLIVGER